MEGETSFSYSGETEQPPNPAIDEPNPASNLDLEAIKRGDTHFESINECDPDLKGSARGDLRPLDMLSPPPSCDDNEQEK